MRSMLAVVVAALISVPVFAQLSERDEANLMAEKIRVQVSSLYEDALDRLHDEKAAHLEVKTAIERDLSLLAPELREEFRALAMDSLKNAEAGSLSFEVELSNLESALAEKDVHAAPAMNLGATSSNTFNNLTNLPTSGASTPDNDRREYATRSEFVNSLVSTRQSTRWVSTSHQALHSLTSKAKGIKKSYRLKASFLGVEVSAGPMIEFLKVYGTTAHVVAEGFEPVLSRYTSGNTKSGEFDFYKRDLNGQIVKKNGVPEKRFMAFWCDVELYFETNYVGSGEFKVAGSGAEVYGTKRIAQTVTLASRRIQVPEYINGQTVTFQTLTDICNKDFLDARFSNKMTVRQSMDQLMSNALSLVTFSHPNTKCVVDSQCQKWFKENYLPQEQAKYVPRCLPEPREGYLGCFIRGRTGSLCPVIEPGRKRAGSYFGEAPCDVGYECVKIGLDVPYNSLTQFLYMPKGECRPKTR